MWARMSEILLGAWLAASAWVFYQGELNRFAVSDVAAGAAVIVCALIAMIAPAQKWHLAQIVIAIWLLAHGFFAAAEPLPSLQNDILVALVFMMLAIVPTEATLPPKSWREAAARS
jgi:hypothetical protein